jgi:hypothetical protein
MLLKFIAAAAVMAAPAVAHAQATTPAYPQDTTRSSSRIHTDSTRVDSSNGSVTTTRKKNDRIRDTTAAGKTKVRSDSTKWHSDSSTTKSPTDSTRMSTPPTNSTRTPPR